MKSSQIISNQKKKKSITLVLFLKNYWDFTAIGGAVKLSVYLFIHPRNRVQSQCTEITD